MERLVRVLDVMRRDRREQDDVAWRVLTLAPEPCERAAEVAELLRFDGLQVARRDAGGLGDLF